MWAEPFCHFCRVRGIPFQPAGTAENRIKKREGIGGGPSAMVVAHESRNPAIIRQCWREKTNARS